MTEGKYKTWRIDIDPYNDYLPDPSLVDSILDLSESFDRFKYQDSSFGFVICAESRVRIRCSTLSKRLIDCINNYSDDLPSGFENSVRIERSNIKYEDFKFAHDDDHDVFYTGNDIAFLDDDINRYPWQREIYEIIYNRVDNRFNESDDREIIWIH